jgi:propionyl-CoA carboxylase beta chain
MGAEQAVALFYDQDIKNSPNPEEFRATKVEEYTRQYADSFALASDVTYVQDIIEPQETRRYLTRSLRLLETKKRSRVPKWHGNIPL